MVNIVPVDPLTAIRTYLLSDAQLRDLVDTRIYVEQIPEVKTKTEIYNLVTISSAGAGFQPMWNKLQIWSLELRCYGKTPYTARQVYLAANNALKYLSRVVVDDVLLHCANPSSGALSLRDGDFQWPFVYSTYQLIAAEQAVD